jgi:hypothetical protein
MKDTDAAQRRQFLKEAVLSAGAGLWSGTFFQRLAAADREQPAAESAPIGRRELVKGLDGMSRVADPGQDPFAGGHTAAAVMSSAFFCREQRIGADTQKEILSLVEARLLKSRIYAPRPEEKADPELVAALVKDLDAGIGSLRRSGHNIIFANISLKTLREVPEAATPARVAGLRKMVRSFGTRNDDDTRMRNDGAFVDLGDETKFVHFVFEEYLKALDLYLHGKGHHGYAGHLLTIGHALLELKRLGHRETANKGVEAYWEFVRDARDGADLGGEKVKAAPPKPPTPLVREYWVKQGRRAAGAIVSSHLIKYPYSYFALAKELRDDELKQRLLDKIYYLSPVS